MSRKVYVTVHGHFNVGGTGDVDGVLEDLDVSFTPHKRTILIEELHTSVNRPERTPEFDEGEQHVHVDAKLAVTLDDKDNIDTALSEMDYEFKTGVEGAEIEDEELFDWDITDSK